MVQIHVCLCGLNVTQNFSKGWFPLSCNFHVLTKEKITRQWKSALKLLYYLHTHFFRALANKNYAIVESTLSFLSNMARPPAARLTYAISLTPCAWLVRVSLSKRLNEKRMGEGMRKRNSFAPSPIVFLVLPQLFTSFCVAVSLNTNKGTR